jgi:hypothetical protein
MRYVKEKLTTIKIRREWLVLKLCSVTKNDEKNHSWAYFPYVINKIREVFSNHTVTAWNDDHFEKKKRSDFLPFKLNINEIELHYNDLIKKYSNTIGKMREYRNRIVAHTEIAPFDQRSEEFKEIEDLDSFLNDLSEIFNVVRLFVKWQPIKSE